MSAHLRSRGAAPRAASIPGSQSTGQFTSQFAALLCLGCALLAALFSRPYLPEQFLRDDAHIRLAVQDPSTTDASSFRAIADLYRTLGLASTPPLAALLGVGVFVLAVFAAIGWEDLGRLGRPGLVMLAGASGIAVVYLGQFSKELITVALAAVVLKLPRTVLGEAGVVLACVGYGLLLRPYWLLIAAGYVLLRLLQRRRARPLLLAAAVVAGYGVLAALPTTVLGGGLEAQRQWINAERAGTTVDTLIVGPFPEATGALSVLSVLVVLAMLLIPLPLLASGDPEHMAAALLICAVWALVLRQLLRRGPAAQGTGTGTGTGQPAATAPRFTANAPRAAALLLAVVCVQALFEPDYGSYLKHLAGLLPLALALIPLRALSPGADGAPPSPAAPGDPVDASAGPEVSR